MKKRKEITIINYDAETFLILIFFGKNEFKIIVTNNPKIIKAEKIII